MLPATLDDAEQSYRERFQELVDARFQKPRLVAEVFDDMISETPKMDIFGGKKLSFIDILKNKAVAFVEDAHILENRFSDHHKLGCHAMKDFMRRAGEDIADLVYRDIRSSIRKMAEEQVNEEFEGLEAKRQRFKDAVAAISKSKSENRRAKLAAIYAFEEERMQYGDDVTFYEEASDMDFHRHIEGVHNKSYPKFDTLHAALMARALMGSGRMKGKNFRKPKCPA